MNSLTLAGTRRGDGYTAWISCEGSDQPASNGTSAWVRSDSFATYAGSAATPMLLRAASSSIERLFDRSGPLTGMDTARCRAPVKCQRASPCTVL